MSFSISRLGETAAELMETVECEFAERDGVEVGVVAVVAEVNYVDEDGDEVTEIRYRCSDGRSWIQAALFGRAVKIADVGLE